ncbi:MAG TPA: AI-2E family transporter [Pricia sp.]|nr:AI-2E family transporter [Pricia sp.]
MNLEKPNSDELRRKRKKYYRISNNILRSIGILLGIGLLLYFLLKIQSVIVYLLISIVATLIGRPIVMFLRARFKFPKIAAVIFTILLMVGVLAGIAYIFVPVLTEQGKNLYSLDWDKLQAELNKLYVEITNYFGASQEVAQEIIKEADIEKNIDKQLNVGVLPKFLNFLSELLSMVGIGFFSIVFISFFFLKDGRSFQIRFLRLIPEERREQTINSFEKIKNLLSRYFIGLLLQIAILFIIYALVLFLVGIENAMIIAFLCALFNIVPYVGPMIGGIIMILLTMTSNPELDFSTVILPRTGYVVIGIVIGQLVDNFFSQPLIFSNSVKSHPLEIFLVILISGLLFGILGMIVAVPAYTVLRVILKEFFSENKLAKALTRRM